MKRVFAVLLSIALFISASAAASGGNVLEFLQLYASRLSDIGDACGMDLELTISPSMPIETTVKSKDGDVIPAWMIAFDHGLLYVDRDTFELKEAYINFANMNDTQSMASRNIYKFVAVMSALEFPLGEELIAELEYAAGISDVPTLAEKAVQMYDRKFYPGLEYAIDGVFMNGRDFAFVYASNKYSYFLTNIAGNDICQVYIEAI